MSEEMNRSPKRWVWAVVVLSLLVGGGWIATRKHQAQAQNTSTTTSAVDVGPENIAVVAMGDLETGPLLSGTLTPLNSASVRAEVAGPILATYVEKGQSVTRGTLLVRIDDTAIREAFESARSAERSTKLALDNAQRDMERNERLEAAGAIAPRDVELSRSTLAAAQAAYADAQSRLTSAQKMLDKTQVRSPLTGLVSERPVNAGDVVQPGGALVTVVDPTNMRLEGTVPASQIAALRVGAPVQFSVNGYPGRSFAGKVDRINPQVDPNTRQVQVYVSLPNSGSALVGGLFAQGRVATESHRGLLAPTSALDERGLAPQVVRIKGGQAERLTVQVGIRDQLSDRVELLAGVASGDTVLLGSAQGVSPGTPIRVVGTVDK
ncbi:MAG TPA: efflux RND transporter periplasmic adaptor subunit [Gemmatimonadaceae bacterium]|nr:efflux RND transporter periplasmic adaptor subunit [Gemmatimonadaceae bacterium]